MKVFITVLILVVIACPAYAEVYHVSSTGPFKTISAAASIAGPGDTITVHEGVYRERINPPRGGSSDEKRIVYQAAEGEEVVIKGSEIVKGWKKLQNDTWQASIPNSFFGDFNPFNDLIRGDWFISKDRNHHTGAVYLNGANPSRYESNPPVRSSSSHEYSLLKREDGLYLQLSHDESWAQQERDLVTTELLGKAKTPNLPYLNYNGATLAIDTDYFGAKRNTENPYPGPFNEPEEGRQAIKVWPKK